jgi:hypothetical protein
VPPPGEAPFLLFKILRSVVRVETILQPGTYWLDWAAMVSSGVIVHPSKTVALSRGMPGDNARAFNVIAGTWGNVIDIGDPETAPDVPQDFPFEINGSPSSRKPFDFDGDGKTDISIFRPSLGEWWYLRSSDGGHWAAQFGSSSDTLVPGDYTGDGKADVAVYRDGTWLILRSNDFSYYAFPFGLATDIPAPADFDGDNRADAAVFRPSTGEWFRLRSSNGVVEISTFGSSVDQPVPADFDGDRRADLAVYRPTSGEWWLSRSSLGVIVFSFGSAADRTVQGDYTGDGKADAAFYRNGWWYVLRSNDYSFYSFPFGTVSDIPVPGDYDGDGRTDAAVFRPSEANWYVNRSTAGTMIEKFGTSTDKPVPNAYVK